MEECLQVFVLTACLRISNNTSLMFGLNVVITDFRS